MDRSGIVLSQSSASTMAYGRALAKQLKCGDILCFFGDLGAGKTTFIKGVVEALTGISSHEVSSPTFTYLNIYEGTCPVYHFDLYRLKDENAFLSMGFEEFLGEGICCIEWSERISSLVPANAWHITINHLGENLREIKT